jgi:hypothetical protein
MLQSIQEVGHLQSGTIASIIQIFQETERLKALDEAAVDSLKHNFTIRSSRERATQQLEQLADSIQNVLENIAEQPQFLELYPAWNEVISNTLQIADNATDMTIHAIAKFCCIKASDPTYVLPQKHIEDKIRRIANIHLSKSKDQQQLLKRTLIALSFRSDEDTIDWSLIDRLTHVFFNLEQAQNQYYFPESKKDR